METKPIFESQTVKNSATTGSIATIALAIVVIAKWTGIQVPFEEVAIVLTALAIIGVAVMQIVTRWKVGDLHLFTKPSE
jgi:hypothetical protein